MKKIFLFIAGLALLSAVLGCILGASARDLTDLFASRKSLRGSGTLVTRTVEVGKFDAVQVSRAIRADIRTAKAGEVVVEADDNLLDWVVVKVEEGTLKIGIDKSVQSISDHHIRVTVPHSGRIASLKASSAAKIVCDLPLETRKVEMKASSAASIEASARTTECSVEASSAASIEASIEASHCDFDLSSSSHVVARVVARDCDADLSSASKLELEGSADRFDADLSSAASLAAGRFEAKSAHVDTSSGSSARIRCTETLKAEASSGSSIRYSGECLVSSRTSSGGSVRKK